MVNQVFSSVASRYDLMNDLMSLGVHRLWKDHFVARLDPAPGVAHLDVAGGTGDIAFRVLRRLRERQGAAVGARIDGHVTVLDINAEMVAAGRARADAEQLSGAPTSCKPRGPCARPRSSTCSAGPCRVRVGRALSQ